MYIKSNQLIPDTFLINKSICMIIIRSFNIQTLSKYIYDFLFTIGNWNRNINTICSGKTNQRGNITGQ